MTTQNDPDNPITQQTPNVPLKDYICPFCHSKLFRGNVNEFKMVCMECNKLVDSKTLPEEIQES